MVAVSTLEALALQSVRAGAEQVMAALDARMGEIYWGCFAADADRGLTVLRQPAVGSPASVDWSFAAGFHAIGRGFRAYPELSRTTGLVLPPAASDALPDAREMAYLGAIRHGAGEGRDPADLTPLYLRDKVAFTERERAAAKQARI